MRDRLYLSSKDEQAAVEEIRAVIARGGGTVEFRSYFKSIFSMIREGGIETTEELRALASSPKYQVKHVLDTAKFMGFSVTIDSHPTNGNPRLILSHPGAGELIKQGWNQREQAEQTSGLSVLNIEELQEVLKRRMPKHLSPEQANGYQQAIGDIGLFYRDAAYQTLGTSPFPGNGEVHNDAAGSQ